MPKSVYIYALREDGSDKIRYVGQTVNPRDRLQGHRDDFVKSADDSNPKRAWVTEVSSSGQGIVMDVIEQCEHGVAHLRERFWIDYFLSNGHELTNVAVPQKTLIGPRDGIEKNRETIFLTDEHQAFLANESDRTGRLSSAIIRDALTWYFAFKADYGQPMQELLDEHEELDQNSILARLVYEDRLLQKIHQDTTRIREIVERSLWKGESQS